MKICNSFAVFAEKIISCFPNKIESRYSVFNRAESVKEMIRDYIAKNKLTFDDKILLISHNSFLKIFTGKWSEGDINESMKDPIKSLGYSWKDESEVI